MRRLVTLMALLLVASAAAPAAAHAVEWHAQPTPLQSAIGAANAFWDQYRSDPCEGDTRVVFIILVGAAGMGSVGNCLIRLNAAYAFDGARGLCVVITHEMGHVRGIKAHIEGGIMQAATPYSTRQCDALRGPRQRSTS